MQPIAICMFIIAAAAASPMHLGNLYNENFELQPKPSIVAGHEAKPNSIPYQAFLELRGPKGAWYCGGSLISPSYILTAGVCGEDATSAIVILGAHSPMKNEDTQVKLTTDTIIIHHHFNMSDIKIDVVLIKLNEPVTLSDAIQTVALPKRSQSNDTFLGQGARISGWGATSRASNQQISKVLNYFDTKVISNEECDHYFHPMITPEVLCCQNVDVHHGGAAEGDNGGPLVVDGVQVGVFATGINLYIPSPSIYARTTKYLDWIEKNTDVVIQD